MRNCMIRLQYTMQRCHTLEAHAGRECPPAVTENARWKSACRVHLRAASSCLSLDAGTQLSVWGPSPPHLALHCRASILMEPVSSSPAGQALRYLSSSPIVHIPRCRSAATTHCQLLGWLLMRASCCPLGSSIRETSFRARYWKRLARRVCTRADAQWHTWTGEV